jgi:hypothetical protein
MERIGSKKERGRTMKKILWLLVIIFLLAGCATKVNKVRAIPPPGDIYANHDCKQLEKVCTDRANEVRIYAARQASKRSSDNTKMTLNVLLLPVFWRIGNNDNTARLQAAMGYYLEASKKAESLKCEFAVKPLDQILSER